MAKLKKWSPVNLTKKEREAVVEFTTKLSDKEISLDVELSTYVSNQLSMLMKKNITGLIEKDGLPYLCHIINGWGNVEFQPGRHLTQEISPFVHYNAAREPFILQRYSEGDYHPWQNFAYCVMSGANLEETIEHTDVSLRTIATNSRYLNIDVTQGQELGHLLFALSFIDPDLNGRPFSLQGKEVSVGQLIEIAIDAHYYGSFEVCRKVHLTEGLCAAIANIDGLQKYRAVAEIFLEGQLDILILLAMIIEQADDAKLTGEKDGKALFQKFRKKLMIHDYIENHAFYVGHLIELATLAILMGYQIKPLHWRVINYSANKLNAILPEFLSSISFDDCFLHLGHYRRGITLLAEIQETQKRGEVLSWELLSRYTTDFSTVGEYVARQQRSEFLDKGIYRVGEFVNNPNVEFENIITAYSQVAVKGFEPKGKFTHFRRIIPPSWPRTFHYEFLDHGDKVGVEIHLESNTVSRLKPYVENFYGSVSSRFKEHEVVWDPTWYNNNARLGIVFAKNTDPKVIAEAMSELISETFPALNQMASRHSLVAFAIRETAKV